MRAGCESQLAHFYFSFQVENVVKIKKNCDLFFRSAKYYYLCRSKPKNKKITQ